MKLMRMVAVVLCLAVIGCLSGCSKADSLLVGRWKNQSLPEVVEFRKDNSGIFLVKDNPALTFTWTIARDNSVKVEIPFQGEVRTLTGNLDKNTFTLNGQGEQAVYVRME